MVTFVAALTPALVAVNVPLVLPAAIVMLAGTVAAAVLLLVSVTTAPPAGAAAFSVTPPCVVLPPTVSPGSTDAYFLTNTLLNSATVFTSPYSATPPVARLLSTPCTHSDPSLYTSMWFPCAFTTNWYQVFAFTVPTATLPTVPVADAPELFTQLYTYKLFVVFRSSYRFSEYRLLAVFTRTPTPHTLPLTCFPCACNT